MDENQCLIDHYTYRERFYDQCRANDRLKEKLAEVEASEMYLAKWCRTLIETRDQIYTRLVTIEASEIRLAKACRALLDSATQSTFVDRASEELGQYALRERPKTENKT